MSGIAKQGPSLLPSQRPGRGAPPALPRTLPNSRIASVSTSVSFIFSISARISSSLSMLWSWGSRDGAEPRHPGLRRRRPRQGPARGSAYATATPAFLHWHAAWPVRLRAPPRT